MAALMPHAHAATLGLAGSGLAGSGLSSWSLGLVRSEPKFDLTVAHDHHEPHELTNYPCEKNCPDQRSYINISVILPPFEQQSCEGQNIKQK